ncbi:MAG: SPOR domain-containing protein [Woeseiaceae bacterium]
MKNLLLLLLLANILYFLWGLYQQDEPKAGVAIMNEAELGPPMDVKASRDSAEVASVGAALGSGAATDLRAVIGRACVTIGPFKDRNNADSAELNFSSQGMKTKVRSEQEQTVVGHWVQIRNVADNATANRMVETLKAGGLTDAYPVRTDDEGLKISLGLFGNLEGAEKVELQALSLELPAEITPRMSDSSVYYVDVVLSPGQGATTIVQKYGEDQVLLRDRATCPK